MKELTLNLAPKFSKKLEKLIQTVGNEQQVLEDLSVEFQGFLENFLENPLRWKVGKVVCKDTSRVVEETKNIVKFELLPFTHEKVTLEKKIWIKVEYSEGFVFEAEDFSVFSSGKIFEEAVENFIEELVFVFQSFKMSKNLDAQNQKEFEKMKQVFVSETSDLPQKSLENEKIWEEKFAKPKDTLEKIGFEALKDFKAKMVEEVGWEKL